MALRLGNRIAVGRAGQLCALALALVIAALVRTGPVLAQDAEDPYSATVKVDATADSAGVARDMARVDGQRRALAAVIDRLSGSSEASKPPKFDDKTITDMVASFEVANERMSAVRYVADYTFHFRPSKVRRLVHVAESVPADTAGKGPADAGGKNTADAIGKTPADSGTRPVIILPVYKDGENLVLWDDPNDWRAAWAQLPTESGPAHLRMPLGDAEDLAAVDAEKAGAGKPEALSSIARRNGGAEAVVALATARRQDGRLAGIDVSLKRYRSGRLVDAQAKSFDANPGESETDFLQRAAEAVAGEVANAEKRNAGARSDQPAMLAAIVPLTSLGEWVQVRDRLASVTSIRKVGLLSLSRQEAKIEVSYVGNPDQLKSSLAEVALDLSGGDPLWRLQPSGTTSQR